MSCNLSDGVILGVDSAVTASAATGGVLKVYEKADKLFQLSNSPIGIATFGIATILQRTVGSYLREFELQNPNNVLTNQSKLDAIVEELRSFFFTTYMNTVVPEIEKELKVPFNEVPAKKSPS